ncbi:MAG: ABC transporter permease [Acidobacteriota bacterium]|jgi:ABC-2 type transport system permease protein
MTNVWAIAYRELRNYFVSPIAYVVMAGFLLLCGWFFWVYLLQFSTYVSMYAQFQQPQMLEQLNLNDLVMAPLLQNMVVIFLIMMPLVTMRLFAEERAQGTDELLLTSPIDTLEIAFGKFLGAGMFFVAMLACTLLYPAILMYYGDPEIGSIVTGYGGILLVGLSFIALGLFTSTLTDNQIVAAVSAFVILLLFFAIGWAANTVGETAGAVLRYLSLTDHLQPMVEGLVVSSDLIYFLSVIAVALFLTQRSLESLRWR